MNVVIVNYGMGNLGSVEKAFEALGFDASIADRPEQLGLADRIVLPGVGAFAEGMGRLEQHGWAEAIKTAVDAGRPLLGICLGMQFLADRGTEGGDCAGLGLIPGEIVSLKALGCEERIPHVGWNDTALNGDPLFEGLPESADFYYVHSFAFRPHSPEHVAATVDYGCAITAAVRSKRIWGTQFHPEKSSKAGLRLLQNFVENGAC